MDPTVLALTQHPEFPRLAGALERQIDQLADAWMEQAREMAPVLVTERPEIGRSLRETARRSILAELITLRNGAAVPDACPPEDLAAARWAAEIGSSPGLIGLAYRVGHAVQWEAWLDLVEGRDVSQESRDVLLRGASRFFFAYANRLSGLATEVYTEERDRRLRDSEHRRVNLVRQLLEGSEVDSGDLDYDVQGWHLGIVACGDGAAAAAENLAAALGRALLLVSVGEQTWWTWMGGGRPLTREQNAAIARFEPPESIRLGFGDDQDGPRGFRETHRQALAAQRAGLVRGAALTRYEDVALEDLTAANEARARTFIADELRGLTDDDPRSRRLRQTLRVYFRSGHNAAATAANLGLHEQTIAQRLRAVEQRVRRPIIARRSELETALRLRAYLDGATDDD